MSLFEKIGAVSLRKVIEDFYDRVVADTMIGFLFAGKDKQRLIDKEWEFTAKFLGADVTYTGKPIRAAHASSPILGGHFARRLQILKQTLADHNIDRDVVAAWVQHTLALRPLVTNDEGTECDHSRVSQPKE